ncbi:MAG: serine/threonine-protein kinase [Bdellovibrionota bacterium]
MTAANTLLPSSIVNERYEVVKCLGTGSMGMVYLCKHLALGGRLIAMKVIFPHVAQNEIVAARFLNEIAVSYDVSHQNVVRTYDYFKTENMVAFTMEYINGGDLADAIRKRAEMPIGRIVQILAQTAAGVRAIHEAGIIHRDLKPENILLSSTGDVKISDFGIARAKDAQKLTEAGGVLGTIDYVSPEYLSLGVVDQRSDLYAIGTIAYELLTGRLPIQGSNVIHTMNLRVSTDPVAARELRKDCPEELNRIVMKALARDPGNRYQTADELLADLERLDQSAPPPAYPESWIAPQSDVRFDTALPRQPKSVAGCAAVQRQPLVMGNTMLAPNIPGIENVLPEDYAMACDLLEPVLVPRHLEFEPVANPNSPLSNVAVSQSRLSNQRMWQLGQGLGPPVESSRSFLANLLFVALFLGIGVGMYLCGVGKERGASSTSSQHAMSVKDRPGLEDL